MNIQTKWAFYDTLQTLQVLEPWIKYKIRQLIWKFRDIISGVESVSQKEKAHTSLQQVIYVAIAIVF